VPLPGRGSRRLAALWLASFTFFFAFFLLLPTLPLYLRGLGASDGEIGLIMGCFAITSMLLRPWTGWGTDRWGRRPFMLAGGIVFVLAPAGYALASGVLALVLVRLLHGGGMALYPTAATAMVADVAPPARRGEFLGLFGAAGSIAMALGPISGIELIARLDFRGLFAVSAATALLALGLAFTTRETLVAPSAGRFALASTFSGPAVRPSLVIGCLMLTYGALVTFLPLHAQGLGVNPGIFFLVYALVLTLARGPAGRLSDRHGRAPVAAAGLALAAVALGVLALSEGPLALAVVGALYGLAGGVAQPALVAWCVDGVAPTDRGRAMGTFFTALELAIALGAMSSGLAVARWGFAPTFLAMAGVAVAGAVLPLARRRPAPPQRGV
jgi:MFS family permease